MDQEILKGNIGPEAQYKLEFKDGKLCIEGGYAGADMDAGIFLKIHAGHVLEALKKAIPGTIDDLVIDTAKKLLGV